MTCVRVAPGFSPAKLCPGTTSPCCGSPSATATSATANIATEYGDRDGEHLRRRVGRVSGTGPAGLAVEAAARRADARLRADRGEPVRARARAEDVPLPLAGARGGVADRDPRRADSARPVRRAETGARGLRRLQARAGRGAPCPQ